MPIEKIMLIVALAGSCLYIFDKAVSGLAKVWNTVMHSSKQRHEAHIQAQAIELLKMVNMHLPTGPANPAQPGEANANSATNMQPTLQQQLQKSQSGAPASATAMKPADNRIELLADVIEEQRQEINALAASLESVLNHLKAQSTASTAAKPSAVSRGRKSSKSMTPTPIADAGDVPLDGLESMPTPIHRNEESFELVS
jgi:hypothetical protein